MKKEDFITMNDLENKHWWFVGMKEICFDLIRRFLPENKNIKILDIGCGTGGNIIKLREFGEVEGCDINDTALSFCEKKGLSCYKKDIINDSIESNKYDVITMFDVLNQLEPKYIESTLIKISSGLKNSGFLVTREPALNFAFGRHDVQVSTKIRFNKKLFTKLLNQTSFEILYISYLNFILFFPIVAIRKIEYLFNKTPKSDVNDTPAMLNTILLNILLLEKFLLRFFTFPFGISIFVIARKI